MGQSINHPVESIHLERTGNMFFKIGLAQMQGWRSSMEDYHNVILSLPKHPNIGFFAVYDGHGGCESAKFLKDNLPYHLDNLKNVHDQSGLVKIALKVDKKLLKSIKSEDGSTSAFMIADKKEGSYSITVGNVGDSRVVLCKNGKAIALTHDHKPTREQEQNRIVKAGGFVQGGRIGGSLALSRAFGDPMYKIPYNKNPQNQQVSPLPDIVHESVTSNDFVFISCDGIFENKIYKRQGVVDFIVDKLKQTDDLALILSDLLKSCLVKGSTDNMTAMLIQFKDGRSYQQKPQYIPGPFYPDENNTVFQKAFAADAQKAGYTLDEALKLRKELVKSEAITEKGSDQKNIKESQRRRGKSEGHQSRSPSNKKITPDDLKKSNTAKIEKKRDASHEVKRKESSYKVANTEGKSATTLTQNSEIPTKQESNGTYTIKVEQNTSETLFVSPPKIIETLECKQEKADMHLPTIVTAQSAPRAIRKAHNMKKNKFLKANSTLQ